MRKLGIIGGLGPMATAYFMELMIGMTKAETDQGHIDMYVSHCPSIPDRTDFLLGKSGSSPLPRMIEEGKKLERMGVDQIAVPCVTAYYFYRELTENIQVPIRQGVLETVEELAGWGYEKVGVMATDGTVKTDLFGKALAGKGISCIYPSEKGQQYVMDLIYGEIKSGKMPDKKKFYYVTEELYGAGVQTVVIGCTELSLCRKWFMPRENYTDVLEVLARECVRDFGVLREEVGKDAK